MALSTSSLHVVWAVLIWYLSISVALVHGAVEEASVLRAPAAATTSNARNPGDQTTLHVCCDAPHTSINTRHHCLSHTQQLCSQHPKTEWDTAESTVELVFQAIERRLCYDEWPQPSLVQ